MKLRVLVVICLFLSLSIAGAPAFAGPTDVPRILLVGDSWTGFMQMFRCFDYTMRDYAGLEGYAQRGSDTVLVGARASEYDSAAFLDVVTAELLAYPTIDIVHLSLGGNDFVLDTDWTPAMSAEDTANAIAGIVSHVSSVIDYILAIRPNIRIGLCGYDFGNHDMGGATPAQMNAVWVQFEQARLALAQSKSRVYYINNLGLMQYNYGIPLADPPIAAFTVPKPGGYADNYVPLPGGDANYNTPVEMLMDDDMHLTLDGYDLVAKRCIEEFYLRWLTYPVVLEILPLSATEFRVTFNKDVTGVDVSDFQITAAKAASVVSVSGSGRVYTVTVSLDGAASGALQVVDDDTIVDSESTPLGGPGAGNGGFASNGALRYAEEPLDGIDDFDTAFANLNSALLCAAWMMGGQSFAPDECDANGGTVSVSPPGIMGNGMLDSYETALIQKCLRDTSVNLSTSGGVTHAMVEAAWLKNFYRMQSDLGGATGRLATCFPGIDSLLAGFITIGDSASSIVPVMLMTAVGVFIDFPPEVQTPDLLNYDTLGDYFGPNGDADGDGATNREEYDYFVPIGGRDMYVMAALDPGVLPSSDCGNSTGGTFNEGDSFCLTVPDPVDLNGGFEWLKDGVPLTSNGNIAGTSWRELHIKTLHPSDSGTYQCVYDNGEKMFGPVVVTVNAQAVPAAGFGGLAMMLGATLLGARRFLRR